MSATPNNLVPLNPNVRTSVPTPASYPAANFSPGRPANDEVEEQQPWGRYLAAVLRFKWLILLITMLGAGAGWGITQLGFVKPIFEASGSVFVTPQGAGDIRAQPIGTPSQWPDFFADPGIVDRVVARLKLYLQPDNAADSAVYRNFRVAAHLIPGRYKLNVDTTGTRYTLHTGMKDSLVEEGAVGDSVGRGRGFQWVPDAGALTPRRSYSFRVRPPRSATNQLIASFRNPNVDNQVRLIAIVINGDEPVSLARTLTVWLREFEAAIRDIRMRGLDTSIAYLEDQRKVARDSANFWRDSITRYETRTVTAPRQNAIAEQGVVRTADPLYERYFQIDALLRAAQLDRTSLDSVLRFPADSITPQQLLSIPSVQRSAAVPQLESLFRELQNLDMVIADVGLKYSRTSDSVRIPTQRRERLLTTLKPIATGVLRTLEAEELRLTEQKDQVAKGMEAIPKRVGDLHALTLLRDQWEAFFDRLNTDYQSAKLAERSNVPDVQVLEDAKPNMVPISDPRPKLLALAIAMSFGLGVLLAILLDRIDKRFRYPEQVTADLGLGVLGAVPMIKLHGKRQPDPEEASQVVEAYRSIRLTVRSSFNGNGQVALTVSSAGVGDGKSMISSNLAISFAEAGYRTLLVDGDTRRGTLHDTFGVPQRPGLLDALASTASVDSVLRSTQHANLTLLPSGTRRRQAPELLAGSQIGPVFAELKRRFDVIIVDSPPLGAGIDPFALSAVTGNILLVFRSGHTDLRMAKAKLDILRRLPIRELGAILNGFKAEGVYRYYSYLPGFDASSEEPVMNDESATLAITVKNSSGRPDTRE